MIGQHRTAQDSRQDSRQDSTGQHTGQHRTAHRTAQDTRNFGVPSGTYSRGRRPARGCTKKRTRSGVDHQTCTFIAHYVLFLDRVTCFGQTEQNSTGKLCVLAASEVSKTTTQALANARGTAGEKAQLIEDSALFQHFFCYFDAV